MGRAEGSSTIRPKTKAGNKSYSSNASRPNPSGTQANNKDTAAKKQNKGKEKLIVPERKSIRIKRPTIKGYGLLTNLKTGQQTFYTETKGILIRELDPNMASIMKGKRKALEKEDGTDGSQVKRKK
ncbi:hypothetical protein PTKIN_Ptkin09bG0217300 [Pterospermum kingtungense]